MSFPRIESGHHLLLQSWYLYDTAILDCPQDLNSAYPLKSLRKKRKISSSFLGICVLSEQG